MDKNNDKLDIDRYRQTRAISSCESYNLTIYLQLYIIKYRKFNTDDIKIKTTTKIYFCSNFYHIFTKTNYRLVLILPSAILNPVHPQI